MSRWCTCCVAVLAVSFLSTAAAPACGFADSLLAARTLRMDAANSKLIVYGTLVNARKGLDGTGTTDLLVTRVLKGHPALPDRTVLKLPRYLPPSDQGAPPRMLVFFDLAKGQFDPFRGVAGPPDTAAYLEGLLALDARDHIRLLRYCFDHLEDPNPTVAADACLEVMKSADADIGKAARALDPKKVRRWLLDPKTPHDRLRLYGFLLGNCGRPGDTDFLRRLADRLLAQKDPPLVDGILTGYALLRPLEGWAYAQSLLADRTRPFMVRYAVLRAARFFHNTRPDVIGQDGVLGAMRLALADGDLADLPLEYLRRWRSWELTDFILSLYGRPSHAAPIVRRAIVRYALQCPRREAAAFVARVCRADPDMVADVNEGLQLETPPGSGGTPSTQ